MIQKLKIVLVVLLFVLGSWASISIVNYQNEQVDAEKHRLMCAKADIRLIRLGWIDCSNR